jgi:hypothetical protein
MKSGRIPQVLRRRLAACHVPAAPPLLDIRTVIDGVAVGIVAVGLSWKRRQHRRTGHRQRVPRHVTRHAFEPPAEARRPRRFLVEGVENRSLPRILRPGLQDAAAANPGHRDVVGEVDGARVAFVDFRRLHAGLRVNEHLRFDRDVQRVERRTQVTTRRIERQRGVPSSSLRLRSSIAV